VLLLTGATGTIGLPVLRRLTARGEEVRCLVRDPRRLGSERVKVQIALGDLGDPPSFRHALRGVDTVVHLASVIRDQPAGTIEELAGAATWRLVRAAERAGVERFIFFSALEASPSSRARLMRAKWVAERAVVESPLHHTVFAPSWVYARDDAFLALLRRMSILPVLPIPGRGRAIFQPLWAEDVADCVVAALPGGARGAEAENARFELAGPQTLMYREIVRLALSSFGRRRPLVGVPLPIVRQSLRLAETLLGPEAFATWDEAELLEVSMTSRRGSADVESLGVRPRRMAEVLSGRPQTFG
jgi:NADH dehydrogenase